MFIISTAAAKTALTTLNEVKAALEIVSSDENDWIQSQINICSATVVSFLNVAVASDGTKTLGRETIVETFRLARPSDELLLSRWPVVAVSSVVEDDTELSVEEYETDGGKGCVYKLDTNGYRQNWCTSKIVVTYDAGWLLPGETGRTLPYEIENACISLIKSARFARRRDPLLKSEDTAGIGSNTYWVGGMPGGSSIPPDIAADLEPYRNITV